MMAAMYGRVFKSSNATSSRTILLSFPERARLQIPGDPYLEHRKASAQHGISNIGIIGGRFLERGRVKRPNQPRFSTELSQYYMACDLYVGARLNFNGHKFILVDGDEYAFNYMERHEDEVTSSLSSLPVCIRSIADAFLPPYPYPVANVQVIMERLQKLTEGKKDDFMKPDTPQTTDYQIMHSLHIEMTGGQISDHEVATVARNYQRRGDETVSFENLISVVQEQLRKVNYENFVKIINQCLRYDRERKGVLSPDDVRAVFVSLRIPINGDLMRAILSKAPLEEGLLRYREFVAVFNWRDNPAPPPPPQVSSRPDEAWMGTKPNRQIGNVDLLRFPNDVFGQ
ncbi:EF-hand domain-containing family member C2 [Lamellibrachia satsuma]|nr:EF-hand domain-containing family member C2 [Lamellibrachia satsuma]